MNILDRFLADFQNMRKMKILLLVCKWVTQNLND